MRQKLQAILLCVGGLVLPSMKSHAQIILQQDYKNNYSAPIGTFQGINFREGGFSGIYPIANTNGKEFWVISDRGVNIDAANANPGGCHPTYDKIYAFPNYAPKIHRIRLNGDSIQILQTITMKRPDGTNTTGLLNPTGFGSTSVEQASTDTVINCINFASKIAPKDTWGIDAEGVAVDKNGFFYVCEEGGPSIWKMNANGVVVKRFTPYAGLPGAQPIDAPIDTAYKYRKNNRGFEGITIAPNGKIYAMIQSPLLYPTQSVGENSRIHRLLEIDPATNATRMFAYINDGIIGTGSNQIRLKDWKIGDLAAINDTTFLVIEAALRGTTDIKRIYKISINGASVVTSGLYGGLTLEGLVDSTGLATNGIAPVKKTLFLDLLANGWNPTLEKSEALGIINDSTIVVGNDNDYAQVSPAENGVATPTINLSHIFRFGLKGANKLTNFQPVVPTLTQGITGPGTAQTPYLTPAVPGANFTSIITAGETKGSYKMCGTPDGLGAFDNNDGTFTLLVNHEFTNTSGVTRAHGSKGAFISKWIINKSDLSIVSGADLMKNINIWNPTTSTYTTYNSTYPSTSAEFNRFCSADLAPVTAYYNSATGLGTKERIFLNGEEAGDNGRAFGHIATGPAAGTSYELPYLGKFSWENAVASPGESDTTVVIGMDDATPGQVYVYIGTKTNTGTDIDKAGLGNGKLFGVTVSGLLTESNSGVPAPGTAFSLTDLGYVQNMTGTTINSNSNTAGVTTFLRPEDGAWDPSNPNDFYFATTNAISSPSRLWRLRFTDAKNPALGGTITAVLDGTEGQKMLDNITIDNYGHILLVEDVGSNAHLGKVWQYDIASDALKQVGAHDSTRFQSGGANFLTIDEEASGIIDVENILGPGMFLTTDQAHYAISGEVVEGGQLLAFFNPDTYNSAPEINVKGNSVNITDGDNTPSGTDNTNFGNTYLGYSTSKTFVIENTGAAGLTISSINFTGTHSTEYSLVTPPSFPLTIASKGSQSITVRHMPVAAGNRTATINIASNDVNEKIYDFALAGNAIDTPEISVTGNGIDILDDDMTPGTLNNTDYGNVLLTANKTNTFVIHNTGLSVMNVSGVTITGTHAADFSLVGAPAFPLVIAAADSQVINVKFAPAAAGVRSATINIANNDADEASFNFAIQGNGITQPEIAIKGNNVVINDGSSIPTPGNNTDFGSIKAGTTTMKSFVIQNLGTAKLTISALSLTGSEAADFVFVAPPAMPLNINAGDSLMVTLQFKPTTPGVKSAVLNIANNDADESLYDFALRGTATGLPEINVQGNSVNIISGDATAGSANNTDFGPVSLGNSLPKTFSIQNTGSDVLSVSGITFSGANAADFALTGASAFPWSIAAGGNQSFTVQFTPAAAGIRSATVTIANNDGDEASYNFALAGAGINTEGVASVSASTSLIVYPNPARDLATIALNMKHGALITVHITDIQGREVLPAITRNMDAGYHNIEVNTASLQNGIYMLRISDGSSETSVRIAILH